MKKFNIVSKFMNAVGYSNGKMEIKLNNGSVYQYKDVPEDVYKGLMGAQSKDTYFDENIKNKYTHNRVA